jgi:hypothetical protein
MFIHEYGSRANPTVIQLTPMRLEAALQFGVGDGSAYPHVAVFQWLVPLHRS